VNDVGFTEASSQGRHWFALQTRSRHEKIVRNQLVIRNIEHLLPTTRRLSQWSDRKVQIEVPLFPGYCFAKLSSSDRLPVLQSQGVVCVVGPSGRPESIPEEEIESLKILLSNSCRYANHPYLGEGALVEVISGPLKGVKGRVVREARSFRLVLSITLIQRAVAVEIDVDCVTPASNNLALGLTQ
jgi:transcription antitermination factor NusG